MSAVAVRAPVRHTAASYPACIAATTVADACEGLADDLRVRFALPSVYLLVDGRLRCQAARGYLQVVDGFPPDTGVIGRVVASGQPVLLDDVRTDPAFIAAKPGLLSEACVPVVLNGRVVGAVNVESTVALPPDTLADLTTAAATLARRIDALGGLPAVAPSQRLARIAVGLSALVDPAEIHPRVVQGAIEISGMASAALCRRGPDGAWSLSHARGPLAASVASWTPDQYRLVASWVQAGTSLHVVAGPNDPLGADDVLLLGAGVRAAMVHPLVVGDEVTGLLITADPVPQSHDAVRGAVLELLAAQAAACLGMAAALHELRQRARHDALTGLRNASAFADDLLDATRAAGATEVAACLFIDVDRFKQVNDSRGHLAGDRLLRALAEELVLEVSDPDALYRIGGDEFAALLRGTGSPDAWPVAQRLVHAARRAGTTVSVGTAMIRRGMSVEDVRTSADRALYRAKAAGRDRAALAPREPAAC